MVTKSIEVSMWVYVAQSNLRASILITPRFKRKVKAQTTKHFVIDDDVLERLFGGNESSSSALRLHLPVTEKPPPPTNHGNMTVNWDRAATRKVGWWVAR